jgi:hypothetical protein
MGLANGKWQIDLYSTLNQTDRQNMSLEQPKPKKQKVAFASDEDKEKQEDGNVEVNVQHNEEGEAFFELSRARRLSLRKYKGTLLVDIREVRDV